VTSLTTNIQTPKRGEIWLVNFISEIKMSEIIVAIVTVIEYDL
jgi:hypothetical protein